jgi:DNA helicase HerA-like ATPase
LSKVVGRLKDRRFDFLLSPGEYDGARKDLHDLLGNWIDHEYTITVLDLGGVPFEVVDLVVGVVTRILFEGMFWGRDLPGMGKRRPLMLVLEEAHSYLPRGGTAQFVAGYAARAVRRVFKEGRKYGVGAIVISQRPSELDETILSQCGTFFALRLSNGDDQGRVKATVPDALAGLIDLLPALRTGEALVLGEAMQIPSRVRLPLIEPRPKSDDPEVAERWRDKRVPGVPYALSVTAWRRQRMPNAAGPETSQGGAGDGKSTG